METPLRSVLVVDDERDLLEMIPHSLARLEARIETANTAEEALRKAALFNFNAILCDLAMPGLSGLSLIAELRRLRCDAAVVIYSGFGGREELLEALRLGAFDFIDKPATAEVLVPVMARAIEVGVRRARNRHRLEQLATELPDSEIMRQFQIDDKILSLIQVINFFERRDKLKA